jgi:membrane protein DedA with SNARE-associated domain
MIESLISHQGLDQLIATYGYPAVALGVGLESMGLPVPGETMLVLAAMCAATCRPQHLVGCRSGGSRRNWW